MPIGGHHSDSNNAFHTIKNLHVKGVLYNTRTFATGGIAGSATGTIVNSSFEGEVHGRQFLVVLWVH